MSHSTGTVIFLGESDPKTHLEKLDLVKWIEEFISLGRLSEAETADLFNLDEETLQKLLAGDVADYSFTDLMRFFIILAKRGD